MPGERGDGALTTPSELVNTQNFESLRWRAVLKLCGHRFSLWAGPTTQVGTKKPWGLVARLGPSGRACKLLSLSRSCLLRGQEEGRGESPSPAREAATSLVFILRPAPSGYLQLPSLGPLWIPKRRREWGRGGESMISPPTL